MNSKHQTHPKNKNKLSPEAIQRKKDQYKSIFGVDNGPKKKKTKIMYGQLVDYGFVGYRHNGIRHYI